MDDNVKPFPGKKATTKAAIEEMKTNMNDGLPELIGMMAGVTYLKYQAYLTAGFTPEQAMQLLCAAEGSS